MGIEVALLSVDGATLVMRAVLVASLILIGAFSVLSSDRAGHAAESCWREPSAACRSVCFFASRISPWLHADASVVCVSWNGHRLERELVIRQTDSA